MHQVSQCRSILMIVSVLHQLKLMLLLQYLPSFLSSNNNNALGGCYNWHEILIRLCTIHQHRSLCWWRTSGATSQISVMQFVKIWEKLEQRSERTSSVLLRNSASSCMVVEEHFMMVIRWTVHPVYHISMLHPGRHDPWPCIVTWGHFVHTDTTTVAWQIGQPLALQIR